MNASPLIQIDQWDGCCFSRQTREKKCKDVKFGQVHFFIARTATAKQLEQKTAMSFVLIFASSLQSVSYRFADSPISQREWKTKWKMQFSQATRIQFAFIIPLSATRTQLPSCGPTRHCTSCSDTVLGLIHIVTTDLNSPRAQTKLFR